MSARVIELRQATGGEFPEMPHNIEAEQALLGAMLLNPRDGIPIARLAVEVDHFYESIHRRIFQAMLDFDAEGRNPAPALLGTALSDVEPIGSGPDAMPIRTYIARLAAEAVTVLNLPDYCRAVRELAVAREGISIGLELAEGLYSRSLDPLPAITETVGRCDRLLASGRSRQVSSVTLDQASTDVLVDAETKMRDGNTGPEITWGFAELDRDTAGLHRQSLVLIGARPKMGKTTWATSFMMRAAMAGHGAALFSLEMPHKQLAARCLADIAHTRFDPIEYIDILRGRLNDNQLERLKRAQATFRAMPFHIEADRGLTISDIASRGRRIAADLAAKGRRLDIIGIDYLGLVKASDRYRGSRVYELAEISEGLRWIAQDLDCAVVALHQLSRDLEKREDKRPLPSDLRDSGALEQDADAVLFLYRHYVYLQQKARSGEEDSELQEELINRKHELEVIIAMQRNGPTGTVRLWCDMPSAAIRSQSPVPDVRQDSLELR